MDNVPPLAGLLLFSRILLAMVLALSIGGILATAFPPLGPPSIFGALILGLVLGVAWQARAEDKAPVAAVHEAAVSKPVALLGLSFLGALWGALAIAATGYVLLSFITIAVAPFLLGPLINAMLKRRYTARQFLFAACGLALGFLAPLAHYVSRQL